MFKNKKLFIALISFLSCISLLSVGYASWTIISNSAFGEANGTITADDVMYSDDYVRISQKAPLLFCNYGFVEHENNSHNLTKEGSFKVSVDLSNLDQFSNKFGGDSLGVEINLKYDNSNGAFKLFDNKTFLPLKPVVYDAKTNTPIISKETVSLNVHTIKFDVTLPQNGNKANYYIDYVWTNKDSNANALKIDKNNWFYQSGLSSTLNRKDLFSFNVKLESKGGKQ